jgi:hypothetical protein
MSLSPRGIEKRDIIEYVRSMRSRVDGRPTQYHKVVVIKAIAEDMLGEISRLWKRGWITRDEVDYIENEFFKVLTQLWKDKVITKKVYSEITNIYTK